MDEVPGSLSEGGVAVPRSRLSCTFWSAKASLADPASGSQTVLDVMLPSAAKPGPEEEPAKGIFKSSWRQEPGILAEDT